MSRRGLNKSIPFKKHLKLSLQKLEFGERKLKQHKMKAYNLITRDSNQCISILSLKELQNNDLSQFRQFKLLTLSDLIY